jgi:multicomponent Na+:H+ antiporter subunit E
MRYLSLMGFLFAFWLALSGHYTPLLLAVGGAAALLSALAALRMRILDDEGHPIELLAGALTYFPWLIHEIVWSAFSVARVILHPRLPISPTITTLAASQKSQAGVAAYANSITLTPGTITIGVDGSRLTVHALVRRSAIDLEDGRMDRRVRRFEGTL